MLFRNNPNECATTKIGRPLVQEQTHTNTRARARGVFRANFAIVRTKQMEAIFQSFQGYE